MRLKADQFKCKAESKSSHQKAPGGIKGGGIVDSVINLFCMDSGIGEDRV